MESDFTLFWKAYLNYRDKYHDAAWEDILTRTLLALPIDQRQQFVNILIEKRIEMRMNIPIGRLNLSKSMQTEIR